MIRFIAGLLAILCGAQAREVETGLASVRQRFARH